MAERSQGRYRVTADDKKMDDVKLALVLLRMSEYAGKRADEKQAVLGRQNFELLWAISHILAIGAETALEQPGDENPKDDENVQADDGA